MKEVAYARRNWKRKANGEEEILYMRKGYEMEGNWRKRRKLLVLGETGNGSLLERDWGNFEEEMWKTGRKRSSGIVP